jgi:hypothetical protein
LAPGMKAECSTKGIGKVVADESITTIVGTAIAVGEMTTTGTKLT